MAETNRSFTDFALTMTRGNEALLDLTATKTQDGVTSPLSLATGVLWVIAKRSLRDLDPDAAFRLNNDALGGVEVTDAAGGEARVTIAPEKTSGLSILIAGSYLRLYVECLWIDADGNPHTIQTGTLDVYATAKLT